MRRVVVAVVGWLICTQLAWGAVYTTDNFVVTAESETLAREVAEEAERAREDLALLWFGVPLRGKWSRPCSVRVTSGPAVEAAGATSFAFSSGEVYGWNMRVQGTRRALLESIVPHEVGHTLLASHFREPLPRWVDEGLCSSVESDAERIKLQNKVIEHLRSARGIAFSEMFRMTEYPEDVMPLYAQGTSLVIFLEYHAGVRNFVVYMQTAVARGWVPALKQHYGYVNLTSLQDAWLDWVRNGSPASTTADAPPGRAYRANYGALQWVPGRGWVDSTEGDSDVVAVRPPRRGRLLPFTPPPEQKEPDEPPDPPQVELPDRPPVDPPEDPPENPPAQPPADATTSQAIAAIQQQLVLILEQLAQFKSCQCQTQTPPPVDPPEDPPEDDKCCDELKAQLAGLTTLTEQLESEIGKAASAEAVTALQRELEALQRAQQQLLQQIKDLPVPDLAPLQRQMDQLTGAQARLSSQLAELTEKLNTPAPPADPGTGGPDLTTKISHFVLVTDPTDASWPRTLDHLDAARAVFPKIHTVNVKDIPFRVLTLPQIVAYDSFGAELGIAKGQRDVEMLLTRVARGEIKQ